MISTREYAARRRDLVAMMEDSSIAVVAAAPERIRSKNTLYPFKQNTNLSYLCGFPEPDAVMLLIPNRQQGEFVFFCRDKDPLREKWDGYRQGPNGAVDNFGADDAFPIDDIDDILPGLLEDKERIYYSIGKDKKFDKQLMTWVDDIRDRKISDGQSPCECVDLDHLVGEMRLIKSAAEVKLLRRAAEISARAHCRAMENVVPVSVSFICRLKLNMNL